MTVNGIMWHPPKIILFITALYLVPISSIAQAAESLPKFETIVDVKQKKRKFFEYLLPKIQQANAGVMADRLRIKNLLARNKSGTKLLKKEKKWIVELASLYNLNRFDIAKKEQWQELLKRVNIVPASLVLAQSANESAWGTSRFAQKANNFFGQWCYKKGCGLVPKRRGPGATHEVRKFNTVQESVNAYIRNLNRNNAYAALRDKRVKLADSDQKNAGYDLAAGLIKYSARREEYVKEIRNMIQFNHLDRYPSLPQ